MEPQKHSQKFLRQRKFLLIVPLLILPFTTMIFWAIGGGKGDNKQAQQQVQKGLNMNLPNAHLKDDRGTDKMAYYNLAALDSAKLKERLKNEAMYNRLLGGSDTTHLGLPTPLSKFSVPLVAGNNGLSSLRGTRDPNEEKVYRKLDELNEALNKATATPEKPAQTPVQSPIPSPEVNRLEKMITTMKGGDGPTPEMQQLNGVLDKLIAIQHPENMQDSIRAVSEKYKSRAMPVIPANGGMRVSLLSLPRDTARTSPVKVNQFYDLADNNETPVPQNTIEAIIPEVQTLVTGATVKLQLLDDIFISGTAVPKGSYVYGTANLNNERLVIAIHSVKYGRDIFPVELQVYDEDGMAGIFVPGAITRDVAKQSADESINSIGAASLDPSIGAQATSAGIQLAKSALSRKIKLVRVTVKAGYRVWLKDANQH